MKKTLPLLPGMEFPAVASPLDWRALAGLAAGLLRGDHAADACASALDLLAADGRAIAARAAAAIAAERASDDDGASWSEPVEITESAKDPFYTYVGTGPGHGIRLQSGRLLFPSWIDEGRISQWPTS